MDLFTFSATNVLLALIAAVSLIALYLSPRLLEQCVFQPYYVWRGEKRDSIYLAGFVHANLLHLAVNLWCLWIFGPTRARLAGWLLYSSPTRVPGRGCSDTPLLNHNNNRGIYENLTPAGTIALAVTGQCHGAGRSAATSGVRKRTARKCDSTLHPVGAAGGRDRWWLTSGIDRGHRPLLRLFLQ